MSDNTAIVTLICLTVVVLLLLAIVIWAAMKGAEKQDKPAGQKPRLISAESLKHSFRLAVELIESNLASRSERYDLSWTLILNEGREGQELPLVQSGLQSALSADTTLSTAAQGISWNFFDNGVAVQLQSEQLGSSDPDAADSSNTWDDFLGLCRSYRPDRPFDSIVLSIPASLFLQSDSASQLELVARAKSIHRRLWLAQNRLALRFPIYLVIAGCEAIPGFAAFSAALPEPMRRSMLGWSSPYELVAPFQAQWVDAAMNEVVRAVADTSAELCALESGDSNSASYFMLANDIDRLRAGLKLFTEELMRPSAYHEPFLLRGMYFTGDCSPAAALVAGMGGMGGMGSPVLSLPLSQEGGDAAAEAAEETALSTSQALALSQSSALPAFLRDVFERKIFAEAGLVSSSTSQQMRRPALGRVARWTMIGVPAVWVIGMGVASFQLHGQVRDITSSLNRLERSSRDGMEAARDNVADPAKSRQRAMDALMNIERMGAAHLRSVFLPGSWAWIDDLHARVHRKLEQGFADNAFDPMRREIFKRASRLTGVPTDPVSGNLIAGASCSLPSQWNDMTFGKPVAALNIEELPEFGATLQYVGQIEELDQVLRAIGRLKDADDTPSSEDLALVVRVLLGAELNGNATRTAELFRQAIKDTPALTVKPLQEATSCALDLALKATYERLFANNALLKSEQTIARNMTALMDVAPGASDPVATIEAWHSLHDTLQKQEALLGSNKGAWMRSRTLHLGQAHDALLQRVQAVPLLGKNVAADAKTRAEDGFAKFQAAWEDTLAADKFSPLMVQGLTWSDTSSSWAFSPSRKALLDALSALLAQPYMKVNRLSRIPDVPAGGTVTWNRSRLDQALALGDMRKRFQTDLMTRFPVMLQAPAARMNDAALAEAARDLLSQAFVVSVNEMQAPAADADRARALQLRAWLRELGGENVADSLSAVLAKDALSRLQVLDGSFSRADIFMPRDVAFRSWTGEKAPLVDAFGAVDASTLAGYVAQQVAFVDAAGKEAEGLLPQLGAGQSANPLVARWQAIVADVGRYRLKSPTSSLMMLEQFILAGSSEVDVKNCMDKLSSRTAQRRAADPFSERMQLLQAGLYTRCREIKQTEFQEAWTRFSEAFNRDLSNRFPFRQVSFDPMQKGNAADVEEVGRVLKLFDRAQSISLAPARDVSQGVASVKRAEEQMQRVREFLAPLYPTEDNQVPGLDLTPEFRANAAAEIDGNKIIDWSLTVGGQTMKNRDPMRPLRWEPGMPITLTMRVARDGPVIPAADALQGDLSVEDRTVTYRFDDQWALLSLMAGHRDAESGSSDARAQLLKFEFPLVTNMANPGAQPRASRARVYVKLAVSPAGKRAPLAWPGSFPVRAPTW
ncbi:type VI secretion system protein [Noviherbaspirillum galbum]|uniref:type VI secretion system protein n=1 Tax=Noviherbaspirillum galbum TaxID=2709383 RepID=UPI001F1E8CCF|nr:type VI secretion system protein [Noviherbaspirillum galbum]